MFIQASQVRSTPPGNPCSSCLCSAAERDLQPLNFCSYSALEHWHIDFHFWISYSISVVAYEYFFFVLCEYFFFFLQCCHDSATWEPWGCLSLSSMTAQPERGQGSQRVGSVLASSCLGVPSHKSATKSDKSPFLRLSYQSGA